MLHILLHGNGSQTDTRSSFFEDKQC